MKANRGRNTAAVIVALALSAPAFGDQRNYAIEGFIGKTDQTNAVQGFDAIGGYGDSRGIRGLFAINGAVDLELGYTDFGTAEDSGIDEFGDLVTDYLESTATQVGIRGTIPLGRKLALTGRAGVALWELDYRQTDSAFPGEVYRDGDEGADPYFGVGLKLQLEENIHLGVEYNALSFTAALGEASTEHDISSFVVSAGFSF
jgi:hypothetical protein